MRGVLFVLLMTAAVGCRDLTLPPAEAPGPGTVRATLLVARPGRAGLAPAAGAQLRWTLSSATAVADVDGNVLLDGITSSEGALHITFEDSERMIDLKLAQVGFGRDVNLGTLVLGRVATLTGVVRRGDRPSTTSGHADIAVFVPETALVARTGDTGDFELVGVAEGDVTVSFFAQGYEARSVRWTVRAGERAQLEQVQLRRSTAPQVGEVACSVSTREGLAVAGARVALANTTSTLTLALEGTRFVGTAVPAGLYTLTASAPGFKKLSLPNLLVLPGVNELGAFVLAPGVDEAPDAGTLPGDGGLTLRGAFVTGSPPPDEVSGLTLRSSAIGARTRVCSGTLCVSGEVVP